MLKILAKAAILVFIILSIYFIVHPYACSNLMLGRVTNSMETEPTFNEDAADHSEMFTPMGDQTPLPAQPADQAAVSDTNSLNPSVPEVPSYTQEELDFAIASRYVELENEYAKKGTVGKDSSKEISYTVMDDFALTPEEWEAFLGRATQNDLFNKVRSGQLPQGVNP